MDKPVLILVPHRCLRSPPPQCDVSAERYAERLQRLLVEAGCTTLELHMSNEYRWQCDPNRATCKNAPMRQAGHVFLKEHRQDARIVEIHSFPNAASWDDRVPSDSQAVVLTMHPGADTLEERVLRETGAAALQGDRVINDIGYEAQRNGWGKRHVLLEMRWNLTQQEADTILAGVVRALAEK